MNITFIVGNGFDKNLGLNTSFTEFYSYINTLKPELKKNNIIFSEIDTERNSTEIPDSSVTWSNFEIALGELTKDTEKLSNFFLKQNKKIPKDKQLGGLLADNLIEFRRELKKFLEFQEKKMDFVTDKAMNTLLYDALLNFESGFPDKEEDFKLKNAIKKLLSPSNKLNYYFITFNYTNCLERGLKNLNTDNIRSFLFKEFNFSQPTLSINLGREVAHVHSDLNTAMILGVDNTTQLNPDLFEKEDLQIFLKPSVTTSDTPRSKELATTRIDSSEIIILYGLSLGESDNTWWRHLISGMVVNKSKLLIINMYDENIDLHNSDYFEIKRQKTLLKRRLSKLVTNLKIEQEEFLFNRIFICYNNNNLFKATAIRKSIAEAEDTEIEKQRMQDFNSVLKN